MQEHSHVWRAAGAVLLCALAVGGAVWALQDGTPVLEPRLGVAGVPATAAASYSKAYFLAMQGSVAGLWLGSPEQALSQNHALQAAVNRSLPAAPGALALLQDQADALTWILEGRQAAKEPGAVDRLEARRDAIQALARRTAEHAAAHPGMRLGFGMDGGFSELAKYALRESALWEGRVALAKEEAMPYSTFFQEPGTWAPASVKDLEEALARKSVDAGPEQAASSVQWLLSSSNLTGSDAAALWLAGARALGAHDLRLQVFWATEAGNEVFRYCSAATFATGPRAYCPLGTGQFLVEARGPASGLGVLRTGVLEAVADGNATSLRVRNWDDRAHLDVSFDLRLAATNQTFQAQVARLHPQGVTVVVFGDVPEGAAVLEIRAAGRLLLRCHLYILPGVGALG